MDLSKKKSTIQSKIVRYKLEEDVVLLKQSGLSYQQIADELNNSGKVPENDRIDKFNVMRFLEKLPQIERQIVKENKKRLLEVVNNNIDIINEVTKMFNKSKALLEAMEEDAVEKGRLINPYQYKAIVSEMREMLNQMISIQKEINDYNNVRKFMEIILETLKEHAPDKIPIIAEKLRMSKGTQWFADIMKGRD